MPPPSRPDHTPAVKLPKAPERRTAQAIAEACSLIEASPEPPSLEGLANAVGLSPSHFHRQFKAITGLTPKAYAMGHRAQAMRTALQATDGTITQAIYEAGFNSNSRFYEKSAETLGMTASAYRRGGEGESIDFAIGACSLGAILVASSAQGVCAVSLGDDPEALARELQDRFPRAALRGDDPRFAKLVATVVGLIEAPALGLELPLDIRGTAFQQRVWQALREIPPGQTASYADIAQRIGQPTATRAVARACATNHIAVLIPCHRVVRTDGALSGYRWGVERKQALLQLEGAHTGAPSGQIEQPVRPVVQGA